MTRNKVALVQWKQSLSDERCVKNCRQWGVNSSFQVHNSTVAIMRLVAVVFKTGTLGMAADATAMKEQQTDT